MWKEPVLVSDVLEEWRAMTGSSDLAKQLNALLTAHFILRREVPNDECEVEAAEILGLVESEGWEKPVFDYLLQQFGCCGINAQSCLPSDERLCSRAVGRIGRLLKATEPLDLTALCGGQDETAA